MNKGTSCVASSHNISDMFVYKDFAFNNIVLKNQEFKNICIFYEPNSQIMDL